MKERSRNYQLDFLKLVFAFIIVICHTGEFIDKNSGFVLPSQMGFWGVHFFFIVSGLFMVSSSRVLKTDSSDGKMNDSAKGAFYFVIQKFQKIAIPYWIALLICVFCFYVVCYRGASLKNLESIVPEFFAITQAGIDTARFNGPTWYISAMLIAMLPMCYLLYRNRDVYLYLFCPLAALATYGFMYHCESSTLDAVQFLGIFDGGIVRALCGISIGGISYILSEGIVEKVQNKGEKVILTIAELVCYVLLFGLWFQPNQEAKVLYSIMIVMPCLIAIVFSGKSLIHQLFQHKMFRFCDTLSLAIYLNQGAAIMVLKYLRNKEFFMGISYKGLLLYYFLCIVLVLCYYYILMFAIKGLWKKMKQK